MRKNSIAFKMDSTSAFPQESKEGISRTFQDYVGGSGIRSFIRKTADGKVIDDTINESVSGTAITKEFHPDIIPMKNFYRPVEEVGNYSIVLKKWHGYIESIKGTEFTAIISDPSGRDGDLSAVFSIDEVSEGDRDLVCENALFDWVISRERKSHGQIENKDFLVFKRFPMWKKSDLDTKSPKVDSFNEWLNSHTSS